MVKDTKCCNSCSKHKKSNGTGHVISGGNKLAFANAIIKHNLFSLLTDQSIHPFSAASDLYVDKNLILKYV